MIKFLAIIMVLSQLGIGSIYLRAGDWKLGTVGLLLGIINAIIFLF